MTKQTVTEVIVTKLADGHPLAPHFLPGGLVVGLVCGYGSATPTAIRYCGEAWPIRGVEWVAKPAA